MAHWNDFFVSYESYMKATQALVDAYSFQFPEDRD